MSESTPAPGSPEASLRVLLVDDHDDLLVMLRMVLARRSFTVDTASSGAEAIKKAENFAPHIIVSDLGMPGMTGLELMERLRTMDELGSFKAIALSGFDDREDEASSLAAGFDAHLAKPIDFERLIDTINRLTD
jgi:two-component system CheB/CheR fusion protein